MTSSHFVSDEFYAELRQLSGVKLRACALDMRGRWLANPSDGEALISFMTFAEVLAKRGLELPVIDDADALKTAVERLGDVIRKHEGR